MGIRTTIQWCDSTVNLVMGCDGCESWSPRWRTWYAQVPHTRFGGITSGYARLFVRVTAFPGREAKAAHWPVLTGTARRDKPWLDGHPRHIFIFDMGEALSSSGSFEFCKTEVIANTTGEFGSRHRWLWLMKRPKPTNEFSPWLKNKGVSRSVNLWVGTTVTDQVTAARFWYLREVVEPIRPDGAFIPYGQRDTLADTKQISAREK